MMPPLVESQGVAIQIRRYFTLEAQMPLLEKFPFIFSCGIPQVRESFQMPQEFRGLSDDDSAANPFAKRSSTPTAHARWISLWSRG